MITSQSRINITFSSHFVRSDVNPSACSGPMLVIMPMLGLMMPCRAVISSGSDMPASKMAMVVSVSSSHIDSGTPIWEL